MSLYMRINEPWPTGFLNVGDSSFVKISGKIKAWTRVDQGRRLELRDRPEVIEVHSEMPFHFEGEGRTARARQLACHLSWSQLRGEHAEGIFQIQAKVEYDLVLPEPYIPGTRDITRILPGRPRSRRTKGHFFYQKNWVFAYPINQSQIQTVSDRDAVEVGRYERHEDFPGPRLECNEREPRSLRANDMQYQLSLNLLPPPDASRSEIPLTGSVGRGSVEAGIGGVSADPIASVVNLTAVLSIYGRPQPRAEVQTVEVPRNVRNSGSIIMTRAYQQVPDAQGLSQLSQWLERVRDYNSGELYAGICRGRFMLRIIGRASRTGPEDTNRVLSQTRADRILAILRRPITFTRSTPNAPERNPFGFGPDMKHEPIPPRGSADATTGNNDDGDINVEIQILYQTPTHIPL